MKKGKKTTPKKLTLSKKTISSLDPDAAKKIMGGEDDTLTKFWTPTTCRTIQTGTTCYSNNATNCATGCATC